MVIGKRRARAIKLFQKRLRELGFNLSTEQTQKLYEEMFKSLPVLRANELPFRSRLDRIEILGFDRYGRKIVMESGEGDMLRVPRKKRGRSNTIAKIPLKTGAITFSKGDKCFFIGYVGGSHRDYAYLNKPILIFLKTLINEIFKNMSGKPRKTGTSTSTSTSRGV